MKNIDWIFFDVGGVLTDDSEYEKCRMRALEETIGQYRPEVTAEELWHCRIFESSNKGDINRLIIDKFILEDEARGRAFYQAQDLWQRYIEQSPANAVRLEAKAVLQELSTKYKLGIIANQPLATKEKLVQAGISSYFSHLKTSQDYGLSKPDPRFFHAVLHETGARAERSAMVDDNIERGLSPAKKLGFTTVWYKLHERNLVPQSIVDYTIENLKEILEL